MVGGRHDSIDGMFLVLEFRHSFLTFVVFCVFSVVFPVSLVDSLEKGIHLEGIYDIGMHPMSH